jgi:hypothetical protein
METYLIGLLIILIVILIGLVYFMSKQVRENDTKLKINIKDLEALRNKVAEMDAHLNAQFHQSMGGEEEIQFDGSLFNQNGGEELEDEEVDINDPEYEVDEEEVDSNEPDIEDITEQEAHQTVLEEEEVVEETVDDTVEEEEVVLRDENVESGSVVEEIVDDTVEEEVVLRDENVESGSVVEETVDNTVEEGDENVESDTVEEETAHEPDILEKVLEKPKKKKYKQPTSKAKDYEVGHRMESDTDGETYEVVIDSKNRPRWKRVSE